MTKGKSKQTRLRDTALNESDLEVEAFIASYVVREGVSPSHRKIAGSLGRALYAIQVSIKKLVAHDRLAQTKDGRGLTPLTSQEAPNQVRLLGTVAAGRPIEAVEGWEMIEVPSFMMKPSQTYFVLRVKGDSMIEDAILDGDYVLVRQTEEAKNGDRVVALIDHEATLKRYERTRHGIRLHPANEIMRPIEVGAHQKFSIAGIYAGVLRREDH